MTKEVMIILRTTKERKAKLQAEAKAAGVSLTEWLLSDTEFVATEKPAIKRVATAKPVRKVLPTTSLDIPMPKVKPPRVPYVCLLKKR